VSSEIRFAAPLPPDVPVPPAALGGGVRWPDGVVRPPGERPGRGVPHETSNIGTQRQEPPPPYRAQNVPQRHAASGKALGLALLTLAVAALAAAAVRSRR
jgi:hypothetical protein